MLKFYFFAIQITGISGDLVFDEFGYRTHINLKLYELIDCGFNQVGIDQRQIIYNIPEMTVPFKDKEIE